MQAPPGQDGLEFVAGRAGEPPGDRAEVGQEPVCRPLIGCRLRPEEQVQAALGEVIGGSAALWVASEPAS